MANTAQTSPYSAGSFLNFIQNNTGLFVLIGAFFLGGFFMGSLWTENRMLKNGTGGSGTGTGTTAQAGDTTGEAAASKLEIDSLVSLAGQVEANQEELRNCIDSGEMAERVKQHADGGSAVGVNGTPGTIIVVNGQAKEMVPGAFPQQKVTQLIDKYLQNPNASLDPELQDDQPTADQLKALPPIGEQDHVRGNRNASVVLVEYSDYECPFCQRFHPVMTSIMETHGDKIAWVYRHLPLTTIHPRAQKAAEAAECVYAQKGDEAFWQYSDILFS